MNEDFSEVTKGIPVSPSISQPLADEIPNRADQTRVEQEDAPIYVTLMKIDETLINYLESVIRPTVRDNDRLVPVPVMYVAPERWKAVRADGFMRDLKTGKAQTPLITLHRNTVSRAPITNPSNKYLYLSYQTRWNKHNVYDRFAVLNHLTPSKELLQVVVPDYMNITYDVILWTEYQEQMNELIEQINVENQEWWGLRNQYKFRVVIDDFRTESELPPENQRFLRTTFTMKVFAYLVPERLIKNFEIQSTNLKRFTAKKVVTFFEQELTAPVTPVSQSMLEQDNIIWRRRQTK